MEGQLPLLQIRCRNFVCGSDERDKSFSELVQMK